jgi:hypothetical protein
MNHIDLPGKEISKSERCQEKRVSFKNIVQLLKNKELKKPNFQTDLDEDKVEEMIKSYRRHPEFLIFKNKIVVAVTIITYGKFDYHYNMYVVDGQHRIEMAKKLYEEDETNDFLNFCFFEIKTERDMKRLFNEINKDSHKNSKYVGLDDFKQNLYDELKQYFVLNKSVYFADRKKEVNKRYTISEFLDKLSEHKLLEKFSKVEDLIDEIENKNKLFCNKLEYKEYYNDDPCPFYKDEEDCVRSGIIYSLKNNNFIEYLVDSKTIPDHRFKIMRKYISPKLRMCVWNRYFGNSENGMCPICDKKIRVGKNGFHCGHIISEANGGVTDLDNLRPICGDCNIDMGSTNWDDYIKKKINKSKINITM